MRQHIRDYELHTAEEDAAQCSAGTGVPFLVVRVGDNMFEARPEDTQLSNYYEVRGDVVSRYVAGERDKKRE